MISTAKKTIYDSDGNILGIFKFCYPEEVVFAFNPLYIEVEIEESHIVGATLEIKGIDENGGQSSKCIDVKFYHGKAKIFYSRILQLFFFDILRKRSIDVELNLWYGSICLLNTRHLVIWGGIELGERFNSYGTFNYNTERPMLERTRIWFKKFPFTVTLFSVDADTEILARYDNKPYDESLLINYPVFDKIVNTIEELGTQDVVVEPRLEITSIVFVIKENRFCAIDSVNNLILSWSSNNNYLASKYYNTENVARIDMVWRYTPTNTLYRFDTETNTIVSTPYGGGMANYGIFELSPELTFPNATRNATYKQSGSLDQTTFSVFDSTFDYTFSMPSELDVITHLTISNEENGFYLRWVDRLGCFQYYLFAKGKTTIKNKLSSEELEIDQPIGDMYFGNHRRVSNIESTITCKCCATSMKAEIYDYVSSIVSSPIIDLYLGKTKYGEEIWLPVIIVAANHDFNNKEILHDLEISFTRPIRNSQTL